MRILVGTLYTIENEFDECCCSIQMQKYGNYEHVVISNRPAKEATFELFRTFQERKDEFSLLVKVDADMVLCRDDLFGRIVQKFTDQKDLLNYQIAVQDFFTDRLIGGMNAYHVNTPWRFDGDSPFVEGQALRDLEPTARVFDKDELAPAALHCKNPSELQAFHFGIHKGVKVHDALGRGWEGRAREHCENIDLTWKHLCRSGDRRLALAALGGELALAGQFSLNHLPYSNPHIGEALSAYGEWDTLRIAEEVSRLRRRSGGRLVCHERVKRIQLGALRYWRRRLVPASFRKVYMRMLGN